MRLIHRYLIVCAGMASLSACAGREQVETSVEVAPAPEPVEIEAPVEFGTTQDALAAMETGDGERARRILTGILEREPGNRMAQGLLSQIVSDPRELLGSESYSYRIRTGDTLSQIASERLDNGTLFFALARYNGISDPRHIMAGQTIRIPGTPPVAETAAPAANDTPEARQTAPRRQAEAARPVRNAARARSLRAQGLAALNRGSISRAVMLLRQAARLDPENAPIRDDLSRALRVQRAVSR